MEQVPASSPLAWLGDFPLGSAIAGGVITQLITLIVWLLTKPRLKI
jgi:hypothetical protein